MEYVLRFTRVLMCLGLLSVIGWMLYISAIFIGIVDHHRPLSYRDVVPILGTTLVYASPYIFAVFLAYMCTGRIALKPTDVR